MESIIGDSAESFHKRLNVCFRAASRLPFSSLTAPSTPRESERALALPEGREKEERTRRFQIPLSAGEGFRVLSVTEAAPAHERCGQTFSSKPPSFRDKNVLLVSDEETDRHRPGNRKAFKSSF